jgi:hypothetical protein
MPTYRCRLFLGALLALLPALQLRAEKPDDSRYNRTDSQTSNTGRGRIPPDPVELGGKSFDQWKADLEHSDPSVRATAIEAVTHFPNQAQDVVPLLVKRTNDQDASPRVKAVLALKMVGIRGTDRSRVVEALGRRISSDTQAIVRYEAAQALMRFGPDCQAVLRDLVAGLRDSSTFELREACIMVIMVAGVDEKKGPDANVIDALILRSKVFSEPTAKVRLEAIMALGAMGRPHDPAKLAQVYRALEDHFHSTNFAVQLWAHVSKMALEEKIDKAYLKKIADHLADSRSDRETKSQAVAALGALQSKAEEFLPEMVAMMRKEKDVPVLISGCQALGRMQNKGTRVLDVLMRQLEREKAEEVPVVIAASQALAQLGANTPEVMEALQKALERPALNPQAKEVIRRAIEEIQKPKDLDRSPKAPPVKGGITNKKP